MIVYNGPYLKVKFEIENNRFINSWNTPPNSVLSFKSELLQYRKALEKINPIQIIWLQQNFTYNIDDKTKLWVEENILKPRFEAGFVTADKDGYHPIAFVVGQDVLSHMEVMGVFDEPSPSVFNPKHFATEEEARVWLNKEFIIAPNNIKEKELIYKGLNENGEAILELRSSPSEIAKTIKTFQSIFEENEFIKKNLDKYTSLTKRELEVLSYLGKGNKHKEIADTLFISIHTVREHIKKIKLKLKAKTSKELLQYYNAFIKK
ncbi:LuxR C-terminal-related transcriptional regulator [Polaribacter vadi]|uniref:helix-turn-helix transcriptional regulator n=1 Tax=Polaribacter TaxID=52959 RepID=UPI001C0914D3|nr:MULTISPECIES: LuxR C-terminal-related transcriptional regulator [Polaribacter]MBU3009789.1 LuxR C-terminal-related transcriptional regulator [Polaribacter vadi]MDO6739594.1 LuxR C-terminal-related transcriptional regulator [Polaribacter sp. 1_MG-2023]